MLKTLFSALLLISFASILGAQHIHVDGKCGFKSTEEFRKKIKTNKKYIAENGRTQETIYLPIKFHRVGNTDGSQKVSALAVLDMMCRLKREYEKYDMIPYISNGFGDVNNTGINLDPSGNSAQIVPEKSGDAIDVFITENANTGPVAGNGTTLGYYSPSTDHIVMWKKEIIDSSETLVHEMGHYLSVDHTFFGWEDVQYSQQLHGNPLTVSSVGGREVELVSRTNGNCETAADQLCDTEADYNFPFSIEDTDENNTNDIASGCALITPILDSNSAGLRPDTRNIMSYYSCGNKRFSEGQIDLMVADYMSPQRSFLRTGYIPNLEEITEVPDQISPTGAVDTYNSINFEWTAVPNATSYVLEISSTNGSESYVVSEPKAFVSNLNPNETYFWSVAPFNETSTCIKSGIKIFQTGDVFTSVDDLNNIADVQIYPNPIETGESLNIRINSTEAFDAELSIISLDGREVLNLKDQKISASTNQIEINTNQISAGMYLLHIKSEAGLFSKQIVIN